MVLGSQFEVLSGGSCRGLIFLIHLFFLLRNLLCFSVGKCCGLAVVIISIVVACLLENDWFLIVFQSIQPVASAFDIRSKWLSGGVTHQDPLQEDCFLKINDSGLKGVGYSSFFNALGDVKRHAFLSVFFFC
ncbi:uncharacterized protein [Spinacia oleracea]|uniref:Uncharacterized protein n=1 Tax=Spinacia oleracea TaxID=3562 RepID=A0ABM3QTX9_SPIOL|nr:uncharacterized protein LOC110791644 [Spinacia oleracea]